MSPKTLLFLLVAALLLGLLYLARGPLTGLLHQIIFPIFTGESRSLSFIGDFFAHWKRESDLIAHNQALREEIEGTRLLLLDRNRLYEENIELKERMGREAHSDVILASVMVRPPRTPYDTLLIDAGVRDRVKAGNLISAGGALLIGKVQEVYANSARVVLFSSPGESHEGYLHGGAKGVAEAIIVEGLGGGAMRARVPRGTSVQEGDVVSFPSIHLALFARVEKIESSGEGSFQTLHLHLPVSFFSLEKVDVWRGE